jgi:cytidyltransferase-like protein
MSKKIVITSGYFNPIHPGHIECFEMSKKLGDELWVILNNDLQCEIKRGVKSFQDQDFRMKIVQAIRYVDNVVLSIDTDGTVVATLEKIILQIKSKFPDAEVIWTKGGDRFSNEIPETPVCVKYGVTQLDGLGAKTHSSSDYVKKVGNL